MTSRWLCLSLVLATAAWAAEPLPPPTILGAYVLGAVTSGCHKPITAADANEAAAKVQPRCRAERKTWQTCAAEVATAWCASH